jgi:hypothetical protein
MHKAPLYLVLTLLGVAGTALADGPIDFDMGQKTDTQTVMPGSYKVRIIHTKPDKPYQLPDGLTLKRSKADTPQTAADTPQTAEDCNDNAMKKAVFPVAEDPKKTEADIKKAIADAVGACKSASLQQAIDTATAIDVGTFTIGAGKTAEITINDSSGAVWTFTLRESHQDLDLATSSGAFFVPPGDVKLRLINGLPGQKYNNQTKDGVSVTIPAIAASKTFDTTTCKDIDAALKLSTEADVTAAVDVALKKCPDAESKSIGADVAAARTQPFDTITAKAAETSIVKIQRGDDKKASWTFSVTGNGSKAESAAPVDPTIEKMTKAQISGFQPTTSVTCRVTDPACPPVYVSSFAQSTITVTDVAAHYSGQVRFVVTANETWGDQPKPTTFIKTFSSAPAQVVISLHSDRRFFKVPYSKEYREHSVVESYTDKGDFAIDFVTQGRTDQLSVTVIGQDGAQHAIDTRIKYQRWFVDMGGFIVLNTTSDEELVTSAPDNGKVSVLKKRNKDKLSPGTGTVLDFHPANYPRWAVLQFGFATSQDRQLSYYFGTGYRLLEIGSNALATFAVGLAASPSLRFPDVKVKDSRTPDDPTLKGTTVYRFSPYISFSFGFRFGDVQPPAPAATSGTDTQP